MIFKHLNDDLIIENLKQLQKRLSITNGWPRHFENRFIIPFPEGIDFSGDTITQELQNLAKWLQKKIVEGFAAVKSKPGKIFAFGFLCYRVCEIREFSISYTFDRDQINLDPIHYDEIDLPSRLNIIKTIDDNLFEIQNLIFPKWENEEFTNKFFFKMPNTPFCIDKFSDFMRSQIHEEFYGKEVKFGKLVFCSNEYFDVWRLHVSYQITSKRKTTRDKIITNLKRNGTVFPYPVLK